MERKKYNPEIDVNYFAKAERSTDDILSKGVVIYIIVFYIVGFFLTAIITAILVTIYLYTKRWDIRLRKLSDSTKANKYSQAKIFGVATTGLILNLYILSLDIVSVVTLQNENNTVVPEEDLALLPIFVLALGLLATGINVILLLSSFYQCFKMAFFFMAISTLCPSFSLLTHLPYILIAFLNDAYHASSVLTFYAVVCFVLFGASELMYGTCQNALINSEHGQFNFEKIIIKHGVMVQKGETQLQGCEVVINLTKGTNLKMNFDQVVEVNLNAVTSCELKLKEVVEILNGDHITLTPEQNAECNLISTVDHEEAVINCSLQLPNDIEVRVEERRYMFTVENNALEINEVKLVKQTLHCCPKCSKTKCGILITFMFTIPIFIAILLVLIALLTGFLVLIPINNAFTDTPTRLIGIYQSVAVIVGIYIIYKKFFHKTPSIEKVVKKRETHISPEQAANHDNWQQLSENERVTEFYSRIANIVANYKDLSQLEAHIGNMEEYLRQITNMQALAGSSSKQHGRVDCRPASSHL